MTVSSAISERRLMLAQFLGDTWAHVGHPQALKIAGRWRGNRGSSLPLSFQLFPSGLVEPLSCSGSRPERRIVAIPRALFRVVPFTPFRIGGELGISPLLRQFAVRQCSEVLAHLVFVRCVTFGIAAYFGKFLPRMCLHPSAIFWVGCIASGVVSAKIRSLFFLRGL